ncbi:hypothetical protein ASF49_05380 [Methylobacterium sp. Leaf104]|uniref:hypothetical protein n=1 Tax=Methylobacterium TaxID=407 RepID=UPI0006F201AD|nr:MULTISPECIES: hypothetical protein [Methylobacterium]KQP38430.1 hypothetical protein ASF49_05380 [Methylobacterium sp. Leaf104]MCI9880158.1 hypothetical protein [Methylobacterium goesingense]
MTATPANPTPTEARLFAAGHGVLVCRYPVGTDLPIPLAVTEPPGLSLLTWAFTGFGGPEPDPAGLLVLHDARAALAEGGALTLETHFRDQALVGPRPRPVAELARPDRAALGAAVLAAVTPDTLDVLATLFPLLAPAVADAALPEAAPRLGLAGDDADRATLSGSTVPNYLLLRAGTSWSCARVAAAELRFGPAPEIGLTLAPAWGNPRGATVETALLLGTGRVTPAALRREGGR